MQAVETSECGVLVSEMLTCFGEFAYLDLEKRVFRSKVESLNFLPETQSQTGHRQTDMMAKQDTLTSNTPKRISSLRVADIECCEQ